MGITPPEIIRQLNRCVTVASNGRLEGWRALIHGRRIDSFKRSSALPRGRAHFPSDFTGAFDAFMDNYPEIRQTVVDLILERKTKEHVHEANVHEARVSDGSSGPYRETQQRYRFSAKSDLDALERWMESMELAEDAGLAYRREVERCLLWAVCERRKSLSGPAPCIKLRRIKNLTGVGHTLIAVYKKMMFLLIKNQLHPEVPDTRISARKAALP